MRILSLLLLIFSGAAIVSTLSNTPAFDPTARQETVLGDWRVAANTAMYDQGAYAFQRGYGFMAADGLISGDTEARDELASAEMAESRAFKAVEALETAVSLDPGNAHAWLSLAWAHAQLADDVTALDALRTSWGIAPHNRVLAETRLNLIGTLTLPDFAVIELTEGDKEAIQRDVDVLNRFDKSALKFYMETLPHVSMLVRIETQSS
jgi:tetratricopeptide (TPR) repeat protein